MYKTGKTEYKNRYASYLGNQSHELIHDRALYQWPHRVETCMMNYTYKLAKLTTLMSNHLRWPIDSEKWHS